MLRHGRQGLLLALDKLVGRPFQRATLGHAVIMGRIASICCLIIWAEEGAGTNSPRRDSIAIEVLDLYPRRRTAGRWPRCCNFSTSHRTIGVFPVPPVVMLPMEMTGKPTRCWARGTFEYQRLRSDVAAE